MFRNHYFANVLIGTFTLITLSLSAQNSTNKTDFQIHIKKTTALMKVDGDLSESAWTDAEKVRSFRVHYPQNGDSTKLATEAQLTYDEHFIYVDFT